MTQPAAAASFPVTRRTPSSTLTGVMGAAAAPEAAAARARAPRGLIRGVTPSVGGVLGFLLLPKCPLCVAAWLGAVGVGAGAASVVAPLLRPAALLLAAALLLRLLWSSVRRARRARTGVARSGAHRESDCCACGPVDTAGVAR